MREEPLLIDLVNYEPRALAISLKENLRKTRESYGGFQERVFQVRSELQFL